VDSVIDLCYMSPTAWFVFPVIPPAPKFFSFFFFPEVDSQPVGFVRAQHGTVLFLFFSFLVFVVCGVFLFGSKPIY